MCNKKDDKYLNNKDFYSDDRLAFECEQALLRTKYPNPSVKAEWNKLKQSIETTQPSEVPVAKKNHSLKTRSFVLGTLAGIAATVLILLVFRWQDKQMQDHPVSIFVAQQGIQEVTMSIGKNQERILSDTKQVVQDPLKGVLVTNKEADFSKVKGEVIKMRTVTTPCGKDYRIVLNDGTEVLMNADSKLTFPTQFRGKERLVYLEGEAYFKVAKNKKMPFVVNTDKMDTRALGTEFNVKAYKGFNPQVTLIEGVVIVSVADINREVRLSPGEEITYSNNKVNVKNVDAEYYNQWKDGFFYFDNVPLVEVLTDLGRWYNVNIEIEKASLMSYRLHFIVNRNSGIDEVVENLNNFSYLSALKNKNTIAISEKKDLKRD
ncbi:FecR domain-containing protein [uncultured Bacteroides sp.]|uniref:FecR family protein n=1 Tax=uncultured Bacteroides sp. TaxID=162156 RepID=UPI002AAA9BEF|nr:FecR domain-containing protein [uncultured Bacteroides sp.]